MELSMLKFSHLPISLLALTIAAPVFAAEPAMTTVPTTMPAPAASHEAAVSPKSATIDINTATASDLKGLPGVSDADATKIVQGRPYKDPSDLVSKKVLTNAEFAKIKDRVVAGHPKS
jgi:DNA uptake protein ComE-like DNA-binding protein